MLQKSWRRIFESNNFPFVSYYHYRIHPKTVAHMRCTWIGTFYSSSDESGRNRATRYYRHHSQFPRLASISINVSLLFRKTYQKQSNLDLPFKDGRYATSDRENRVCLPLKWKFKKHQIEYGKFLRHELFEMVLWPSEEKKQIFFSFQTLRTSYIICNVFSYTNCRLSVVLLRAIICNEVFVYACESVVCICATFDGRGPRAIRFLYTFVMHI